MESSLQPRNCTMRNTPGALAKLAALFVFVVCVVSFGKYNAFSLAVYFAFPLFLGAVCKIGQREILRKSIPALCLAFFAGFANFFIDTKIAFKVFSFGVSFAMLSLFTLLLKAYLCVAVSVIFAKTTPANDIAGALAKLKIPCIVVVQIMLTIRYLNCICSEASRMAKAYALRSPMHPKIKFAHYPTMLASLFTRTLARANSIYNAMQCRNFDVRNFKRQTQNFTVKDAVFFACFAGASLFFRFFNIPLFVESFFYD